MEDDLVDLADLQGASRVTGGLFRGQALGNALNAADFVNPDVEHLTIKGVINVFNANSMATAPDPTLSKATSTIKLAFIQNSPKLVDVLLKRHATQLGMFSLYYTYN